MKAKAYISGFVIVLLSVLTLPTATSNAACVNDPGNNNGDCVSDQYGNDFCENSWKWHDCVQGTVVEDPDPEKN